jgi:Bacterial PH domain
MALPSGLKARDFALSYLSSFACRQETKNTVVLILGPAILLLVLLLVAWPMTYDPGATRSDGEPILLVRGGLLLRYEIPIAGIREVRPSKSVLSSMSWSYDRIEVISRSPKGFAGSLLISPRDRDAFLDDLVRRAGDLVRVGDRLTRRQETHAAP